MTFYNLPGVDAKIDFDPKTKVLKILNLTDDDRVTAWSANNGDPYEVTVEIGKWKHTDQPQ